LIVTLIFFFNLQSAAASASPFQSTWYSESEITQGARSRSQNQQRDHDSKRPKLSCTNCTSTSAGRNVGNSLNAVSGKNYLISVKVSIVVF
jgi:E3 ubiquitin-protein ligase MARCH7